MKKTSGNLPTDQSPSDIYNEKEQPTVNIYLTNDEILESNRASQSSIKLSSRTAGNGHTYAEKLDFDDNVQGALYGLNQDLVKQSK